MLSHVFPHIILVNEGIIPPASPAIAPLDTRKASRRLSLEEGEFSLAEFGASHDQDPENDILDHSTENLVFPSTPHPSRVCLSPSPTHSIQRKRTLPLRRVFTPEELMPTARATPIARPALPTRHTIATQPQASASKHHHVYEHDRFTVSDTFVNRRSLLLQPLVPITDPIMLRQLHQTHGRSFSLPTSPVTEHPTPSTRSLHSIPEDQVGLKTERFYAKYNQSRQWNADDMMEAPLRSPVRMREVIQHRSVFEKAKGRVRKLFRGRRVRMRSKDFD